MAVCIWMLVLLATCAITLPTGFTQTMEGRHVRAAIKENLYHAVPAGTAGEVEDAAAFFRSQPQFDLLDKVRSIFHENPKLLDAALESIGRANPSLLQVISKNQEEFQRFLNEKSTPPFSAGSASPEDKEAIERLKSLGFFEYAAVKAYFDHGKNETLAANFLLQSRDETDDD